MVSTVTTSSSSGRPEAEPAWDIARLFPPQGQWTEGCYLSFTESISQIVELVDGSIEVAEMPSKTHQQFVHALLSMLLAFLRENKAGDAVAAPYRVRLRDNTFREPDIVVFTSARLDRFGERYGESPDLVMEIVSDDVASRARDYEDKRSDYARASIPEYWIVDPAAQKILVLTLDGNLYRVLCDAGLGAEVLSQVLSGFRVGVDAVIMQRA